MLFMNSLSGMVHTGFDATPGLTESQCLIESRSMQKSLLVNYEISFRRIGAIVVAWTEEEVKSIDSKTHTKF